MIRFIAAIGLIAVTLSPADACSLASSAVVMIGPDGTAVPAPPPPPPPTTDEIIAGLPEVVFDGEVVEHDPIKGDFADGTPKVARVRVDRVWKGDVGPFVILHFTEDSAMCGAPPPVGRRFRMGESNLDEVDLSSNELWFNVTSEMSLDDPDLGRALVEYKRRTDAMLAAHASASRSDRRAVAEYFQQNGEATRALRIFKRLYAEDETDLDALLDIALSQSAIQEGDEASATFARLREIAPRTEAWRGKLARADFETSGLLRDTWKDWSGVTNHAACERTGADFDDARFDSSQLYCRFAESTFRRASFKHTDLSDSIFEEKLDFTGATYDCATKFPDGFDPKAAGMINMEGSCAKQP